MGLLFDTIYYSWWALFASGVFWAWQGERYAILFVLSILVVRKLWSAILYFLLTYFVRSLLLRPTPVLRAPLVLDRSEVAPDKIYGFFSLP